MKKSLLILLCFTATICYSQTAADVFKASEYEYTYLGIDYSHAKFKGDFSQFADAGITGVVSIKDRYFSGWNNVVKNEKEKYNLKNALRKEYINYDLSDITKINNNASIEGMEGKKIIYSQEDIQGFINSSSYSINEGIGIMFFAEYLDKDRVEACFHFVLVNMATKDILIHERMVYPPAGIGLRNYWIKPVYLSIDTIRTSLYRRWKKKYSTED